ncbi:hypothetical protein HMPREF0972_01332 [Actinomyces sp. oral taxon 848 str. F0332]|nr:hypothetical protein HMPREF0972_01332 [Actinomyces sp. oral taxon 848 str. F0332]
MPGDFGGRFAEAPGNSEIVKANRSSASRNTQNVPRQFGDSTVRRSRKIR